MLKENPTLVLRERYLALVKQGISGELDVTCPSFLWDNMENVPAVLRGRVSGTVRTLLPKVRLDNIQQCITEIMHSNIPGDLFEAGCWKGGAVLFMKACLATYPNHTRKVWAADIFENNQTRFFSTWISFQLFLFKLLLNLKFLFPYRLKNLMVSYINQNQGFPPQNYDEKTIENYLNLVKNTPISSPFRLKQFLMRLGLEEVKESFRRYDLLDEGVVFLEGWFENTLPEAKKHINSLALLRADSDFFSSTLDILKHLYPKLSSQGFCIIDDYGTFPECKKAVDKYREEHKITEIIQWIDKDAVFWQKR